jgi:hypothetical protein
MKDKLLEEYPSGAIFNEELKDKKRRTNRNTNMGEAIAARDSSRLQKDTCGLAKFDLKAEVEKKWQEKVKRQQEKRKKEATLNVLANSNSKK